LTRSEIWRVEKYLRNLFRLDTITLLERPQSDSVEVHVGGEFIGLIFKDEEDGEISYAFNMSILENGPARPTGVAHLVLFHEGGDAGAHAGIDLAPIPRCARLKR